MTTQATAVQQSKSGMVAVIGATALTLVALGGAAFWGLRPGGETAVPATVLATSSTSEGALPKGGLAERYDEMQAAAAAVQAARGAAAVTTRGGMAELVSDQEAWAPFMGSYTNEGAPSRGGMAELYAEQTAAARTAGESESQMGGLAELYRDHELERAGTDNR